MPLSSDLYKRCRRVLQCDEFENGAALQAVFITKELAPFRSGLPEAGNKAVRVDACLAYLLDKRLSDGRPVFPLFLGTLVDRYSEDDSRHGELATLAEEVQTALAPTVSRTSTVSTPPPETPRQTATITWLHLSDLHFQVSKTYDSNVVLQALRIDVAERIRKDELQPDFVVVTGDTAFTGQPAEYALAETFFEDLLKIVELPRDRLLLVPGNHDVDRGLVSPGAAAIGESLTGRDKVNTLLTTPGDRQLVLARFRGYAEFINRYFGQPRFDDEHYFYVCNLDVNGYQVALLGLNSAWLCASDQDKAKGLVIGERQTRTALQQAEGSDLKIALLHHPLDWLREFDRRDSEAMVLDSCDFVLHGHLHQTGAAQLTSPDGSATVLACGACYETRDFPNMYNWVRLDLVAGSGIVYLRRYSDARGGFWAKDTLTYRNAPDGEYPFQLPARLPGQVMSVPGKKSQPTNRPLATISEAVKPPAAAEAPPADSGKYKVHIEHATGVVIGDNAQVNQQFGGGVGSPVGGTGTRQPAIDLATLRRRLDLLFDDAGLDALCFDHFTEVYDRFSRGMRKDEKITMLLDYCRREPARIERLVALLGE